MSPKGCRTIGESTSSGGSSKNETSSATFGEIATNPNLKNILAQRGEMLHYCSLNFTVAAQPQHEASGSVTIHRQPDGMLAAVLSYPAVWAGTDDKTTPTIAARSAFNPYLKSKALQAVSPEISDFHKRRESTLIQLEALN